MLLHGDYWKNNLLWENDRIAAILDWEDAALGDPMSDLACALLELRYLYGETQVAHFQTTYLNQMHVDRHRLLLWQVYTASAAQHYMSNWGLEPDRELRMRTVALEQIRQAGTSLYLSAQ
jgi:aminoglycoside phosphotransferase (APT) family kinase protein